MKKASLLLLIIGIFILLIALMLNSYLFSKEQKEKINASLEKARAAKEKKRIEKLKSHEESTDTNSQSEREE